MPRLFRPLASLLTPVAAIGLVLAAPAHATATFTMTRTPYATDRFATAAALADVSFTGDAGFAGTVVVVNGDDPVDGLAAAGLAGTLAPILYTRRNEMPQVTLLELQKLRLQEVVVIGGANAISEEQVALFGDSATRIAGPDRYATAAGVAQAWLPRDGTRTTAVIARGDNYADALAASAYSARERVPILLTEPGNLPDVTVTALRYFGITDVTVVGGTAAVSTSVTDQLTGFGVAVRRVSGQNRFATARAVADDPVMGVGTSATQVVLVNGDRFVDALPASVAAARRGAPVLLAPNGDLGPEATGWLQSQQATLETGLAVGGTGVLPESVLTQARAAAGAP